MKLHRIIKKITGLKTKVKAAVLVAAALTIPVTGFHAQAAPAQMEGNVESLNVTTGQTAYTNSTSAMVDDVVQVQLWHHNMENPAGEKANNTVVKFAVPNAQGTTQTITGTSSSTNGNTISDTTTLNLSLARAHLEYIPGSAKFRYNKGAADGNAACETGFAYPADSCYATVSISDSVVSGGVNLDTVRGGPLTGCNAHHETVTIQVRVRADVVSVNKYVRKPGEGASDWKASMTAKPGEKVEYLIRFKNEGNTRLDDVMVGDNLPKYHQYVNDSTWLSNGDNPSGIKITNNNLTKGGINVGNYMPGAVGYVWFTAQLDPSTAFEKCGNYDLRNVGVVRPAGMNEHYNTAQLLVNVECATTTSTPTYRCDLLRAEKIGDRKYKFTTTSTATGGATVKQYRYTFGDNTAEMLTDKNVVEHSYANNGTYVASVTVEFTVSGASQFHSAESCKVTIKTDQTTTTTPTGKLPNTGAGSLVSIFAATTLLGAAAHFVLAGRRNS